MLEFKYSDMINDPGLSSVDRQWVLNFQTTLEDYLTKKGGYTPELSMFNIASSIGLDVTGLHKEGMLLYALWITMLNSLQKYITIAADFKYPTIESFLAAYPGYFQNESEYEKKYLWLAANWMCILFRMITARKNKGLVLYVVPKLIEGWDAKYVTGSGQTKATANRVHIFETEGNTKANQRGKAKGKKRSVEGSSTPKAVVPKVKKPKRDPVLYDNDGFGAPVNAFAFTEPFGSTARYREQRHAAVAAPMPLRSRSSHSSSYSDIGDGSLNVNNDVKTTFAEWQAATENFGLGLLNLSRDNSFMNNGLAPNVDQQLTDPLDYQRGFSWTEIPVAPAPLSTANSTAMGFSPQGLYGGVATGSLFPPDNEGSGGLGGPGKLNLEVGSVVSGSALQDMFQGYK